jgi:hypothetical protein
VDLRCQRTEVPLRGLNDAVHNHIVANVPMPWRFWSFVGFLTFALPQLAVAVMTEPLDDDYLLEHAVRLLRRQDAPRRPDRPAAAREHEHYVEPFAGSLAVLLAKPRAEMETVNDLDQDLMTFWRVLRDRPEDLALHMALTPHSRAEHQAAYDLDDLDDLERARRVWVLLSQGRGGSMRRTGWRFYRDGKASTYSFPEYLAAYVNRVPAAPSGWPASPWSAATRSS